MPERSNRAARGTNAGSGRGKAAETVSREGERPAEAAGEMAKKVVREQKSAAANYVYSVTAAVEAGSRTLEQEGLNRSAAVLGRASADVRDIASRLEAQSPAEMARELEQFALKHPALFFCTALFAGFGAARFLKTGR